MRQLPGGRASRRRPGRDAAGSPRAREPSADLRAPLAVRGACASGFRVRARSATPTFPAPGVPGAFAVLYLAGTACGADAVPRPGGRWLVAWKWCSDGECDGLRPSTRCGHRSPARARHRCRRAAGCRAHGLRRGGCSRPFGNFHASAFTAALKTRGRRSAAGTMSGPNAGFCRARSRSSVSSRWRRVARCQSVS